MGALLDVIGAVVAGSLVVTTIILSILNFQEFNFNIQSTLYLTDSGEEVVRVLDQYYLSNIEDIDTISPRLFRFKAKLDNVNTDSITIEISNKKETIGYPMTVTVVNMTTKASRIDAGPFVVADTNVFTFYNKFLDTTSTLDDIRNMRIDLSFPKEAWSTNNNTKLLYYPITFWKSLKTIYINKIK